MFEVKKGDREVESFNNYPVTTAQAKQFICINGTTYLFDGISKVRCDKGDNFNSAFGKELAETNATIDMLKEYKKILIKMTKQPEWRKEKPENKSKTLKELVGKWAIRTKPPEGMTDTSFCSDPVYVRKVTDTHAVYTMQNFLDHEHLFTGRWLDNNWIDYKELMSKE